MNNFARASYCFINISLPSLHDHDVKMPNFKFYWERKQTKTNFFPYAFAYIWQSKRLEIIAKKNETMRICFLLKEQYPVTAHVPNFDFLTGCREFKRCEENKRFLKNPFASPLAEFDTTLKLLRITDQWYIVQVKFRFGRNRELLAGGSREGKGFNAGWRLTSPASFHTNSDNRERHQAEMEQQQ